MKWTKALTNKDCSFQLKFTSKYEKPHFHCLNNLLNWKRKNKKSIKNYGWLSINNENLIKIDIQPNNKVEWLKWNILQFRITIGNRLESGMATCFYVEYEMPKRKATQKILRKWEIQCADMMVLEQLCRQVA